MPTERGQPLTYKPITASDAVDGTNAPQGAMTLLTNLIPDPATRNVWVPRPAIVDKIDYTLAGFTNPGFVSGWLVVGDTLYGMIATDDTAAHDQPFAYDLASDTFLTIGGVTSANVPVSPPSTGAWTPPILAQVATRVIVTHPGFPGKDIAFGWFDVSGTVLALVGDTVSGDRYIRGGANLLGVQQGMLVTGTGIPAGTTVIDSHPYYLGFDFVGDTHSSTTIDGIADNTSIKAGFFIQGPGIAPGTRVVQVTFPNSIDISQATTATASGVTMQCFGDNDFQSSPPSDAFGDTHSNTTIDGIFPVDAAGLPNGVAVGQFVSGAGLQPLTTITAVGPGNQITISHPATSTVTGVFLKFTGSTIVLSAAATATNDGVAFTIAGGTAAAPVWGAGNTANFPLPSVPVGVAQMNGRAFYALGVNGIVFSDSRLPCSVSNSLAVQALTTNDGLAVTAIAPLQLSSLLGGVVQSLIAFEGTAKMQQITGDQATANLAMNSLPVATGTNAPLSLCSTQRGLAFISPEGLRIIDFSANVSKPIGDAGDGVTVPFINSVTPSRICAASNADVIRVTTENGGGLTANQQEWWYDLSRLVWSGPHTCPASLIEAWRNTFLLTLIATPDEKAYTSDVVPSANSLYIEHLAQLSWAYRPSMLPDSGVGNMVDVVEMTLACELAPDSDAQAVAISDLGEVLDITTISGDSSATIWGQFIWGGAVWGQVTGTFRQRSVNWHIPLVFRQATFIITGQSFNNVRVGNLYMRYQILDYMLEEAS